MSTTGTIGSPDKGLALLKNTLILGFGSLSAQLVGLVLLPLYTANLSTSDFGFVDVVTVAFSLILPVSMVQLHLAAFRFLVDAREDAPTQQRVFTTALASVTMAALVCMTITYFIGQRFLADRSLHLIVIAGISTLFCQFLSQVARGLGKNLDFAVASTIVSGVTLSLAVLTVGVLKTGVSGVFASLAAANAVGVIFLAARLKVNRLLRPSSFDKSLLKRMLGYSIPLIPNGVAWWINNAADRFLLAFFLGTSANGIYAAAAKIATILNAPNSVFALSWAESASLHINAPDRDRFFSQVADNALRIFGSGGLFVIVITPFLYPRAVGPEYQDGMIIIPILIVGIVFNALVNVYDGIYIARMMTRQVMITTVLGAVMNMSFNLLLIPTVGILGAACGTTLTFILLSAVRHFTTRKIATVRYSPTTAATLVTISGVVFPTFYLGDNLALQALSAVLVVLTFLWLNWQLMRRLGKKLGNIIRS